MKCIRSAMFHGKAYIQGGQKK